MHLTCGLYNTEVRRSHWIHPPEHSSYTCAYPWGCCELKPLPSRHWPAGRIGNRHSLWTSLSQINGPHVMKIIANLNVNAISIISHHHLCLKIHNPVDKRGSTVAQTFELTRLNQGIQFSNCSGAFPTVQLNVYRCRWKPLSQTSTFSHRSSTVMESQ